MLGILNVPEVIGKIIAEGARGVQLFYIASAFTLFLSFKNRKTKEISPVKNFFIRRFFRIAPIYYIGIFYYLLQDGFGPRYWLGDVTHVSTSNIIANATFIHGFNPYWIESIVPGGWSIGVEMTFYVILPFLFSKIKNINQAFNFFLFSLFFKSLLGYFFIKFPLIGFSRLWNEYLFFYFPNQLPIFSLGIIMYFIIIEKEAINKISGKGLLVFSAIILAQLATGIQFILPSHILFGIGFLMLGIALSSFRFKFIVNPIIIYIGKISFSMYIVHFAILHWLANFRFSGFFNNGILNYVTKFSVVTILSIIVASILYRLIEVPFQDLGKKIINRMESKHRHVKELQLKNS